MAFDDERLSTNPTDKEQWAEDHGYVHGTCRTHGGFWTDTGSDCPSCLDEAIDRAEEAEDAEDEEYDYGASDFGEGNPTK